MIWNFDFLQALVTLFAMIAIAFAVESAKPAEVEEKKDLDTASSGYGGLYGGYGKPLPQKYYKY